MADCLVPKWGQDEVFTSRPCHEEPCLHRRLAECPADRVPEFAGRYGLLTFSIPRHQVGRKVRAAEVFQPEPVALWLDQIRRLRSVADLWDRIVVGKDADVHQARTLLGRKITQAMAGVRFDLTVSPEGKDDHLVMRYQPRRLIDAIWQRFAEEIAGVIACARCPAPRCGRWFLRSAGREDREYCCHACQVRAWRAPGQPCLLREPESRKHLPKKRVE